MFKRKPTPVPTNREMMIDRLYAEAKTLNTESDDFKTTMKYIDRLEDTKEPERKNWVPSPDAVITAIASLSGIVLIIFAERVMDQVITSKATGFVQKPR